MKHWHRQIRKRAGLVLGLIALQCMYFPINQNVQGGVSTVLPIDRHIPLSPIWAVPYLCGIVWWAGAFIWAAAKMDNRRFLHFSLCLSLAMSISYVIYVLFPTYVNRPVITGEDFPGTLVLFIYGKDRAYNALPSGHTYTTLIISIFWYSWLPEQRGLWAAIALIIILSTLLTKQHAVLDILSAGILAFVCYKMSDGILRKALPRSSP
ncbi:MAG: phosphatase PAP2 family protein [Anaerolineales bacterium]|nr:phosphatase PAP2 family protein [Anaerolineales bacterium]